MTEAVLAALGLMVGVVVGWFIRGPGKVQPPPQPDLSRELAPLLAALRDGRLPEEGAGGTDPAVHEVVEILGSEWAPRGGEDDGVDAVVKRALSRLAIFLRNRVESPLLRGLDEGGEKLQEGADVALGAVEDLEFFLEAPAAPPALESKELVQVVDEVLEEFGDQSPVRVEVAVETQEIPVHIHPERLKDAVFLVLHNAAEFGDGEPVKVTVRREGNRAIIRVRDQGPGFTAEALMRALDPFYSTSPEGLGLGLPHALNAVRSQGGQILLRNPQGGGGEVEIVLPVME